MMGGEKKFGDHGSDEIWVLGETKASGELSSTIAELSGKAKELAESLLTVTGESRAVMIILLQKKRSDTENRGILEKIGEYGADKVIRVTLDDLPWDRAASARVLAHLIECRKPQIVLAAATAYGRSVMPYAAALLQTGLTADCTELDIELETGQLLQTRPAIGGNIMATIKTPEHRPQMATVRPRTFRIPKPVVGRICVVEEPALPSELLEPTVKTVSCKPFPDEKEGIQEKDVIVSGGRGLRRPEGFALLAKLATELDGGVGASRPTVEMKWTTYPHQVGLSGQVVSPKVYIAAGISGAVQHLAGMQTAGKIVSINRDPDAPIFRVSDIAICGDLYEIIPILLEKIQERRNRS